MNAPDTFELPQLGRWLAKLRADGRTVLPASSRLVVEGAYLRLQHDVDFSLNAALAFAKWESAMDVHSTYNVLVGSDFYDIARATQAKTLDRLRDLGHTIGLHFDPRYYEHRDLSIAEGLRQDVQILRALGHAPEMICCHRPRRLGLGHAGLADAVAGVGIPFPDRDRELYVSDSAGGFSHGGAKALENPPPHLRLNLHPEWWGGSDRLATLNMIVAAEGERLNAAVQEYGGIQQHPNAVDQDERDARSGNPARRARVQRAA